MKYYNNFAKNILLPLVDIFNSTTLYSNLRLLEKSQWWSEDELKKYQQKKLRNLINEAYNKVPYYHRFFRSKKMYPEDVRTLDDLKKLPIVNKELISENPNDFINKFYNRKNIIENRTGGTTGQPFRYFISKKSNSFSYSQNIRGFSWGGLSYGSKRATLAGSSLLPNQNISLSQRFKLSIERNYPLSAVHMSNSNMRDYFNLLKSKKIKFLRGYPSAIFNFSKYLEETNKDLNLKSIFTTAEVLVPNYRKHIEDVFDCPVYDNYGCKDGGGNAMECSEHNGLHASTERSFLELISDDGENGDNGEMLWTDFENLAMPFIRYSPGDIGTLSQQRCSCGRKLPLIKKIEGRQTDNITFSNGITISGPAMTLIFKDFNVSQYQIIQTDIKELTVKIIKNKKFKKEEMNQIKELLVHHCGSGVKVNIEDVKKIDNSGSSKFQFIKSEI